MNCPNCGKELAEGEVCTCVATEEQNAQAAASQQYYAPQPPVNNVPYTPPVNNEQQATYFNPAAQAQYAPQAPVEVPARTDYPEGYKPKKKLVAVVLAVTLGMFGIHNYYLGNQNKFIAQLLICLLGSLVVGIGFAVAYIWAIVEAVQIFTEKCDKDANGYKIMTFEESIAKAVNENK